MDEKLRSAVEAVIAETHPKMVENIRSGAIDPNKHPGTPMVLAMAMAVTVETLVGIGEQEADNLLKGAFGVMQAALLRNPMGLHELVALLLLNHFVGNSSRLAGAGDWGAVVRDLREKASGFGESERLLALLTERVRARVREHHGVTVQ